MATTSQGITLSYKSGTTGATYTALTNLQEIPDLGGDTDSIEITTLADTAHVYTNGLKNYGDGLAFKFLYDKTQFTTLNGLTGTTGWQITLSDNTTCTFSGSCSVKLDGVGNGAVLTYTLTIKPSSAMAWA